MRIFVTAEILTCGRSGDNHGVFSALFTRCAFASNRDFFHLTLAIEEMEMVIGRAIAGEAPDASTWGPLRASDFLPIVQDVTSWALTNFQPFKARPAAEELPHGISGTGSPYFRNAPRLQPP